MDEFTTYNNVFDLDSYRQKQIQKKFAQKAWKHLSGGLDRPKRKSLKLVESEEGKVLEFVRTQDPIEEGPGHIQ